METTQYTTKQFPDALADLMRDRYADGPFGTPTIAALVRDLKGEWHYENVRKMLANERGIPMSFIEAVARLFGKEPTYFVEFRVHQVCLALNEHPEVLGEVYQLAMDTAARLEEKQSRQKSHKAVDVPQGAR